MKGRPARGCRVEWTFLACRESPYALSVMNARAVPKADSAGRANATLHVMIVDDHDVVRQGIKALLESTGDITVVAEASTVTDSIERAIQTTPDVVVMDVRLGSESGIEATREIRSRLPGTRVLMLTSFADDEALVAAMLAGASGYVLKEVRSGDIVRSVRDAAAGKDLFEASTAAAATKRVHDGKHLLGDRLALLSPQEERILERVAEGKTNAEIAEDMGLAEKTVKHYVSNVLMKLEVARRAEAAAYLARHSSRDE
jgi:two-component system, NarL family, response regulator DevR